MKQVAASFLLLFACAGASPVSEAYNQATAGPWKKVAMDKTAYRRPLDLAAELTGDFPESLEGSQTLDVSIGKDPKHPGYFQMIVTATGQMDDSVEGEQWRVLLVKAGDGWIPESVENRWRCYIGRGSGQWNITPCS